ncbi:MAG: DUF1109 domain-containing protein [Alphaproteobacteria bacterium]|nr:DUF1109 family protein [Alphaproteobacteria bacterium]MDE2112155.1 DUF1109 domain-containing protein [Alphaproteobacteria bacterium]MDE2495786.1 DUF1109 domain-containing protein [Alphaproteobacteria bacterium]
MKTEALIERLAERADPVAPGTVLRTLALGLGGGAAVSALLMLTWLGPRPDLAAAMTTGAYWVKFFYTLIFAIAALAAVERLGRPGAKSAARAAAMLLPFLAVGVIALWSWSAARPGEHAQMLYGGSYDICPWRIVVVSLPVFAGVFWALRKLAPTGPVLAGAAGGLLAGGAGAFIYAFHCTETGMPFLAIWYTLGIIMVGALGAVLGRFSLRW